tara:strand:- start:156 stop:938 length:783 start_codon:yes stop_codon:yes gene_type:complete
VVQWKSRDEKHRKVPKSTGEERGKTKRENSRMEDARSLLGVPDGASEKEIKDAYHQRIRNKHPDRNHNEDATRLTQELNAAKELLLKNLNDDDSFCLTPRDIQTLKKDAEGGCKYAMGCLNVIQHYYPEYAALAGLVPASAPGPEDEASAPPSTSARKVDATSAFLTWLKSKSLKNANSDALRRWVVPSYERPAWLYTHLVKEADRYNSMMNHTTQGTKLHRALLNKILQRDKNGYKLEKKQFCKELKACAKRSARACQC